MLVNHGWDIKILSPAYVFLKDNHSYHEMFSESQFCSRKEQKLKRKEDEDNIEHIHRRHQTDAESVLA